MVKRDRGDNGNSLGSGLQCPAHPTLRASYLQGNPGEQAGQLWFYLAREEGPVQREELILSNTHSCWGPFPWLPHSSSSALHVLFAAQTYILGPFITSAFGPSSFITSHFSWCICGMGTWCIPSHSFSLRLMRYGYRCSY
jgi:hypothetical protein